MNATPLAEVVCAAVVALAALGVAALVLCRIIDKAQPAPLDRCLAEARDLVASLMKRR